MEEQVAQKSSELEQYLQRVRELEDMYLKLQEALEDERQARQDEETVRKLQARCRLLCSPPPGALLALESNTDRTGPSPCVVWRLNVRLVGCVFWSWGTDTFTWGLRKGLVPESSVVVVSAEVRLFYSQCLSARSALVETWFCYCVQT